MRKIKKAATDYKKAKVDTFSYKSLKQKPKIFQ